MTEPMTDAQLDDILAEADAALRAWVERHTPREHITEVIARITKEQ
jgi:hypothetical protein